MNATLRTRTSVTQLTCAALSIVLWLSSPSEVDDNHLVMSVTAAALAVSCQFVLRLLSGPMTNWVSIDVLFSLTFSLVHFGIPLAILFDSLPIAVVSLIRSRHLSDDICSTTAACSAALSMFLVGFNRLPDLPVPLFRYHSATLPGYWQMQSKVARVLVLAGAGFFALFLRFAGRSFFAGEYLGTNRFGFAVDTLFILSRTVSTTGIALSVIAAARLTRRSSLNRFDVFVLFAMAIAILIHGDRATFLLLALTAVAAYSEHVRRISLPELLVSGVVLLFLFGVVLVSRKQYERNVSGLVMAVENEGPRAIELAYFNFSFSGVCAYQAVDYVPRHHSYYWGKMQINGLLSLVPFSRTAFGTRGVDFESSYLFTWLLYHSFYSGAGTSIYGDLHLDFGPYGAIAAFCLLGYLCKYLQVRSRQDDSVVWQVVYPVAVALFATVSRESVASFLTREIVYPACYVALASKLLRARMSQRV